MFVLEYSEGNALTTDNECRAYHRVETARAVMMCQLERVLTKDGYSISKKVKCAPGFNDLYGNWAGEGGGKIYLGFLNDLDAYLEDGEHRWVIHEIPGAFIPEAAAQSFEKSIKEAFEMYSDEGRVDWFDADDVCKNVCWDLEEYLGGE